MPEVWRPYFLSLNGPVMVTDFVMLKGVTATAVAAVSALRRMERYWLGGQTLK
jgi:hypothetical protein